MQGVRLVTYEYSTAVFGQGYLDWFTVKLVRIWGRKEVVATLR